MSPDPGKEYTVKCALKRAVPDLHHLENIREAVLRTNKCTYLATELVNLYVRDRSQTCHSKRRSAHHRHRSGQTRAGGSGGSR
jgi:hypothetical protein